MGDVGRLSSHNGEVARIPPLRTEVVLVDRPKGGKSGDLGSSSPAAETPLADPLLRLPAGDGLAKPPAKPNAEGGPPARILPDRGEPSLEGSESVLVRFGGRGLNPVGWVVAVAEAGKGWDGGADTCRSNLRREVSSSSLEDELSDGERIRSE